MSNPGGGEIFCTRPERLWDPPSLYFWYRVIPGGIAAGAWCGHPHPSGAKVKERVELYFYFPFWAFVACSRVTYFYLVKIVEPPLRV